MQYTIRIPKPCEASWDEMTPVENGRHCAQCCKTVIDFTNWQPEEIVEYLQRPGQSKVCGKFKREQIDPTIDEEQFIASVAYATPPLVKKIAAIFLFAFGLLRMKNEAHAQTGAPAHAVTAAKDTGKNSAFTGKPKIIPRPKEAVKNDSQKTKKTPAHHIMGGAVPVSQNI